MKHRLRFILCSALVVMVFWPCTVAAQQIPPAAEPGRTKPQLEERGLLAPAQPMALPEDAPQQPVPAEADHIKFVLQNIMIEGATVYSLSAFKSLYAPKLGTEISMAFVYEVASAITARYRNDGYILSRAIIPPQRIKDGIIKIHVVEGYIDNVVFENSGDKTVSLLKLYGDKITGIRPLNTKELERYLLLMRDVSGVHIESVLRPGSALGAAELLVGHTYDPVNASFSIDNHGTVFLGPIQGAARFQGNGILATGDTAIMRYIGTDGIVPFKQQDLRSLDFRYRYALGSEGLTMGISATKAISFPKDSLEVLEVKTQSKSAAIDASYPVIRSRQMNLSVGGQFDYQNDQTQILGDITADDRLRSLRVNASFDYADSTGISQVFAGISQGLKILNNSSANSPNISRANGKPDYIKANVEVARLQKIYGPVNLYAAVAGQYSPDRLLAAEEFGLGGNLYGRGYDPSEIVGDRGIAGKIELQYNHSGKDSIFSETQLYGFYDVGSVYQTESTEGGGVSLASAGLGLRMNMTDWLTGVAQIAKPLTHSVSTQGTDDGKDPRAFFALTVRY